MNIILNNTINEVHENITIEELRLSEDDKVEIITAIGGG
jgi:sulfur carrier protein ThiS